jgi:3-keto-5-aminohexanoate cleavage enzyme
VELDAFNQTLELIRARCDIIIEGSTGGMNTLTVDERCVSLDADIELASLNPGSVNYAEGVYINSPQDVNYWTEKMYKRSVKPDMAIFETGMIATCERLAAHGLIASPMLFTFVMGLVGAIPAGPKNLLFLSETVPPGSLWAIAGYNGADLPMSALAMNMGGHVRAGFEDNAFYRPGERATSNAQLIERLVRMAREIGREPATPDEAREMLAVKTA